MLKEYYNNTDTKLIKVLDTLPQSQAKVIDTIMYKVKSYKNIHYKFYSIKEFPAFKFIDLINDDKDKKAAIAVYEHEGKGGFDLDIEFKLNNSIILESNSARCKNFGAYFGSNKYWVIDDVLKWINKP